MWYYMTKYSFDASKPVVGPFKTEREAWDDMEKVAINEYESDLENCFDSELYMDREAGEILIMNYHGTHQYSTEFFTFEI